MRHPSAAVSPRPVAWGWHLAALAVPLVTAPVVMRGWFGDLLPDETNRSPWARAEPDAMHGQDLHRRNAGAGTASVSYMIGAAFRIASPSTSSAASASG